MTAADIPSTRPNSCDITFGVAAGSVAPGANLSLTVPAGTGRTADIYIYQRFASTDACPLANQSFAGLDHSRIFKVGSTSSIDTTSTEVDVSIDVSAPAIGASILSQLNLGSNCAPSFQVKGLSVSSSTAFATDQFFKSVLTTGAVSGERRSTNFKLKNTQINF